MLVLTLNDLKNEKKACIFYTLSLNHQLLLYFVLLDKIDKKGAVVV